MRTLPNNVELFKTNRQSRKYQQDKNKNYYQWILRQNEAWFYKLGIKVSFFFMYVYAFGFLIFLIWHLKKQDRNVLIFSFILFIAALFCHISFNQTTSPHNTLKTLRFTKSLQRTRQDTLLPGFPMQSRQVVTLPHLLGESCLLNYLFAPCLTSGRITFLGHSSAVLCDLIFLW